MPAGPTSSAAHQQRCWWACRSTVICMLQVLREMAGAIVQPLSTLREAHLPTGAQLSGAGTEAEAPKAAALATGQWVSASAHQNEAVGAQKHQQGSHGLGQGLRTDQQELVERQQSSSGDQHGSLDRQQGLQERQQGVEAQGQVGHSDTVPLAAITEQFSSSNGAISLQAAADPAGPSTSSIRGPANAWLTASVSRQAISDEGPESEVTGQGPHRPMPSTISSSSVSAMPPAAAVGLPVMRLPASTPLPPPSQLGQAGTSQAKPEWGAHPAAMADQARAAGNMFGLGDRHRASLDRRHVLGAQARRPQSLDLIGKQRQSSGTAGLYRWAFFCLPLAENTSPPPGSQALASCTLQSRQHGRASYADCPLKADVCKVKVPAEGWTAREPPGGVSPLRWCTT